MGHRCLAAICLSLLPLAAAGAEHPFQPPRMTVPDGFVVEVVAAAPLVQHPMMAALDEQGHLYVTESSGANLNSNDLKATRPHSVRRLEDSDGDGVFDKVTVFADKMTYPQGALWHDNALFVASPPDVWRLDDTDGDGVADRR